MNTPRFQAVGADADQAQQAISNAAQSAGAAIRDASEQFRSTASDVGAKVSRRADEAVRDLSKQVEAQPVSAILIAAGAGLVAGLLLARR